MRGFSHGDSIQTILLSPSLINYAETMAESLIVDAWKPNRIE